MSFFIRLHDPRQSDSLKRRHKQARRRRRVFLPLSESLEDRRLLSVGALDATFGVGGLVTTNFTGPNQSRANDVVAIQSNGDIVAAGATLWSNGSSGDFALARYTPSGSLDSTFGTGGEVKTAFGTNYAEALSVAIQGDGKIVVAGYIYNGTTDDSQMALARYNGNGSLDTTFGNGGEVITNIGGSSVAQGVTIQGDGKIVVAGASFQGTYGDSPSFALARYNSDGSLDTTFGTGGEVTTSVGNGSYDGALSVAIQANGDILAAGLAYVYNGSEYFQDFALARYNTNGGLDTTFGAGGMVTTAFGTSDAQIHAVAIQSNGQIVAAGSVSSVNGYPHNFALARYNSDGSLDTAFGTGGEVTTAFAGGGLDDEATGLVIQSDGRIVAAGFSQQFNGSFYSYDFALARYNSSNGGLDSTFGSGGEVISSFGLAQDQAYGVAIETNGEIVAAGTSYNYLDRTGYDFTIALYQANGAPDTSFGSSGTGSVTTAFYGPTRDNAQSMAIQADGKIVVAGEMTNPLGSFDIAVSRYNTDGSLDTSFGAGGKVTTSFGSYYSTVNAVAIQADGKIVVAGAAAVTADGAIEFALARYNSDGSLDTTFGPAGSGEVTTDVGGRFSEIEAMVIQPDGSILVTGRSFDQAHGALDFTLVRYNSDGALDTTFGAGGVVTTSFVAGSAVAGGVALQSNGQIVVAGYVFSDTTYISEFAVARYNSDGSLDSTFGAGGEVFTSFGALGASGAAVAIQGNGQIVVAGTALQVTNKNNMQFDFALARYNTDGSLDSSFGQKGEVTTAFGTNTDNEAFALAIQDDGKIVAAGESGGFVAPYYQYEFALARYNSDGSLDKGFGAGGQVTTGFGSNYASANAVAIQADGNIVLAGLTYQPNVGYDFALARYIGVAPVQPIDAMIADVENLVDEGVLDNGQGNSLLVKLQHSIQDLNSGQDSTADNNLQAFINEIDDYISEGLLTNLVGQALINDAEAEITLIGKNK